MKKRLPTYFILALSLVLVLAGLFLNQQADVFTKAARICLECIGIG